LPTTVTVVTTATQADTGTGPTIINNFYFNVNLWPADFDTKEFYEAVNGFISPNYIKICGAVCLAVGVLITIL